MTGFLRSILDWGRSIIDWATEIGGFLDAHNGAVSAISAVFVALFTFTLWRATDRLWRTSQEQAQHTERSVRVAEKSIGVLPILERAYVFIATQLEVASTHTRGQNTIDKMSTKLTLMNHGKTPAIVKAIHYRFFIADDPNILEYSASYTDSEIIIPGSGTFPEDTPGVYNALTPQYQIEHGEPNVATIEISAEQSEKISAGKTFCVLLARAVYLDIFDRQHETASCRIYDGRGRTFAEHGGEKYNYRT